MSGTREYDIIIVGGGPAGSSLAIRLAQSGFSTLLVEQKTFPREKLCGEFISPECLPYFAELGVLDQMEIDAAAIERTVFYARNGRSVAVPSEWFGATHALGLSRARMDSVLLDRARAAGVTVVEDAQVNGLLMADEYVRGITVRNRSDAIARLTIDATGRARVLAREIDRLHNITHRHRAEYVAFKAHVKNASSRDTDCEIYGFPGGYGGCVRVENGQHNVCFIVASKLVRRYRSDIKTIRENTLLLNKRARKTLQNAAADDDWLAVPIEEYGRAELAPADGLLTVGDAAGFIDPFTGSGILLALESAKVLSDAIAAVFLKPEGEGSFRSLAGQYQRRYHAAFDGRLRVSSLVRRAAFAPFLGETVVRILALSSGLTRIFAKATRPSNPASSFPQAQDPML